MDKDRMVQEIDAEIARLQQMRDLLTSDPMNAGNYAKKTVSNRSTARTGPRVMSVAARKRIAEAQKKRWAMRKKAEKEAHSQASKK